MAKVINDVSQWFWSPEIWLPPNVTWDSFRETIVVKNHVLEPTDFANFSDLWYPVPLAILVIIVRSWVEKKVFKPLGIWLGLKDHRRVYPAPNQQLELAFTSFNKLSKSQKEELAISTQMTYIQVERWLRQRHQAELPNTLQKFCETGWRWIFYTGILIYGFICLWNKPWFWNIRHCWYDYPYHTVDRDVWIYYMVEMAFYWSLSISQFFDVKRKDFWEMFIHHNTTIALMMFSWTAHFTRIGTLVLIVHDCSDHLLELAKLCRYVKYRKLCDAIFALFSVIWIVTRCGIYPSWILYSTLHDAAGFIQMFPAYYIFNTLLGTLQVLHLVWTYFLIKAVHKALVKGGIDDNRSDSEPSEDSDHENNKKSQ
jgi:ceramide synthetase